MIKNFIKYSGKSNNLSSYSLATALINNSNRNNNLSTKLYSEAVNHTCGSSINILENTLNLTYSKGEREATLTKNLINLQKSTLELGYSINNSNRNTDIYFSNFNPNLLKKPIFQLNRNSKTNFPKFYNEKSIKRFNKTRIIKTSKK